jgi:ABC-type nickel/cobalt efflux system permease component RcnA
MAHPLDVSSTVLSLGDTTIQGITYLHNYEVSMLLSKNGHTFSEIGEMYQYRGEMTDYIRQHLNIQNNAKPCTIVKIDLIEQEPYIVLTSGFQFQYTFQCDETIKDIVVSLDLFTNFDLQTNRLSILESNGREVFYKVGTHKIIDIPYTRWVKTVRLDTDNDGLPDEEELVYKTNANNRDSDRDFYLDGEEVNYGWNPLNPDPSPGQEMRHEYPANFLLPPQPGLAQTGSTVSRDLSQAGLGSDIFQNVLKKIGKTVSKEENTPFVLIFFLVMGLGFLHALGPWHAKSLLTAMMIHKKASFRTGFKFILIFSITHIIDIFFLYLCLALFMRFFDSTSLLNLVPKISALALLGLWCYLLFRVWRGYEDDESEYSISQTWIMGIIAGLAPCTFGWSLFFLLLSLGKMSWIPALIFAIAIGIFLCLLIVLILITVFKKKLYTSLGKISEYSLIFSAGCIFLLWLYFTITSFNVL